MALFFVYILQTFLTTAGTASQRRNSQEEHFFFREFGCLESVSEVDFDMCLQRLACYQKWLRQLSFIPIWILTNYRSACESPDRAMKILETVGPISGRSPKYGNMLTILRQAAGAGLDGQDCSTLWSCRLYWFLLLILADPIIINIRYFNLNKFPACFQIKKVDETKFSEAIY